MKSIDPRVPPFLVPEGSQAVVVAEHQDEYIDLPSVRTPASVVDGELVRPPYFITRWEPTEEERMRIVRGEDVYITIISTGLINPLFVTVGVVDWTK